jgi:phosphatidylglycerol---prolipoprotein diacylglyceryl transferase
VQSFLSLGRFHIPVFGLFAAVGLMSAMWLCLRTARLASVDPDGMWDLGMVTVFSAFVVSRGLLVISSLRTFLTYPMLVLELPSLTKLGVYLTVIVALIYVRRKKLPLLNVLDAAVPCAALLQVFLSMGRVAEGTREGMPTTIPWSIPSSFGRVHPVELYSAIGWLVLCGVLVWILMRVKRVGETAAWGLMLGGLLNFFLDFFRLPAMLYGTTVLDGEEWRGLEMLIAGGLLLAWRYAVDTQVDAEASLAGKGISDAV